MQRRSFLSCLAALLAPIVPSLKSNAPQQAVPHIPLGHSIEMFSIRPPDGALLWYNSNYDWEMGGCDVVTTNGPNGWKFYGTVVRTIYRNHYRIIGCDRDGKRIDREVHPWVVETSPQKPPRHSC